MKNISAEIATLESRQIENGASRPRSRVGNDDGRGINSIDPLSSSAVPRQGCAQ